MNAAHEDMDRFLQFHLDGLCSQSEMQNLVGGLAQRIADHQSRVRQLVYSAPLKNTEVAQWVLMGMSADRPMESNFFPGILEGLLWRLGIAVPGVQTPPTSVHEGAARAWANAVSEAIQKGENRRVQLDNPASSGMPLGLHINYEVDFLHRRSQQIPEVFTNPSFMPNIVDSISKLKHPMIPFEAQPFSGLGFRSSTPVESVDDKDDQVTPSLPQSTVGTPIVNKVPPEFPGTPITITHDSDVGSEATESLDLTPDKDSTYTAEVNPTQSEIVLRHLGSRKQTHSKSEDAADSKDSVPSKKVTVKK